jgi:hypothetical protein
MARRPLLLARRHAILTIGLAVAVAVSLASCRDTPIAFGPSAATARERGDELLEGMQERFTNVQRSVSFSATRAKLGRAALTPARVYDDSTVWTAIEPDGAHSLTIGGHYTGDHYVFAVVPATMRPAHLADARHEIRLRALGHNQFEWTTSVEQAMGSTTADDMDRIVGSMLSDAATIPDAALATDTRAVFPHATAALGRMFSLDSVHTTSRGDGTARVRLCYRIHADGLQATYPAYAAYLRKYVSPARLRFTLSDAAAGEWFELRLDQDEITVELRATHDGHFAPLTGPVRPMPDSLTLLTDVHGKVWIFSVGMTDLLAEFTVRHTPHERDWDLRFRHDPRWHLPLFADHFVKTPLRRPFADSGASYHVAVRDTTDGPTLFTRAARIVVQESTIMRWLGGLGATAMGDFSGPSDAQESAYFVEILAALRADLRAVPALRTASDSAH